MCMVTHALVSVNFEFPSGIEKMIAKAGLGEARPGDRRKGGGRRKSRGRGLTSGNRRGTATVIPNPSPKRAMKRRNPMQGTKFNDGDR